MTVNLTKQHKDSAIHSDAVIEQFGDGIPYDRVRVIDEARFYLAQSAEAMLEAGKRLVLIKEHEAHGDFQRIVQDQLGMPNATARRLMQAAMKYLSPQLQSKRSALSVLGKTKLFELLAEDDEQLASLDEGGTVAGLTLDDIDRMTSRELRAALREAKEQEQAKDQVLADKNQRIDQLSTDLERSQNRYQLSPPPPEEESEEIRKQAAKLGFEAEHHLRVTLREALQAVLDHGQEHGIDAGLWVRGQLDQIADSFNYLCEQLGTVSWLEEHPPYLPTAGAETEEDEIPLWNGEAATDMETES
ncbi:Phage protein [Methylophaga frappieri]|uniref:Phage protein n=1 Tax=Methylophaga frappieri (strain ATCC BAA-2434 / DSM 25690 / JAM7) TaxID=754477 RepID=I1YGE2_METFJ|nr:DUF3102 domain-containing protein [Methylophaga frappieri]AFJ01985.1 Phage protein [Methylophaga frappieri]